MTVRSCAAQPGFVVDLVVISYMYPSLLSLYLLSESFPAIHSHSYYHLQSQLLFDGMSQLLHTSPQD